MWNLSFYKKHFLNRLGSVLFTVVYKDGKELEFIINEDVDRFQNGYHRFFFEEDIMLN